MTISKFLMNVAVCAVSIGGISTSYGSSQSDLAGVGTNEETASVRSFRAESMRSSASVNSVPYFTPEINVKTTQKELMQYFLAADSKAKELQTKANRVNSRTVKFLTDLADKGKAVEGVTVDAELAADKRATSVVDQLVKRAQEEKAREDERKILADKEKARAEKAEADLEAFKTTMAWGGAAAVAATAVGLFFKGR